MPIVNITPGNPVLINYEVTGANSSKQYMAVMSSSDGEVLAIKKTQNYGGDEGEITVQTATTLRVAFSHSDTIQFPGATSPNYAHCVLYEVVNGEPVELLSVSVEVTAANEVIVENSSSHALPSYVVEVPFTLWGGYQNKVITLPTNSILINAKVKFSSVSGQSPETEVPFSLGFRYSDDGVVETATAMADADMVLNLNSPLVGFMDAFNYSDFAGWESIQLNTYWQAINAGKSGRKMLIEFIADESITGILYLIVKQAF